MRLFVLRELHPYLESPAESDSVDATPTSGTIFVGGGQEAVEVAVHCEPVSP